MDNAMHKLQNYSLRQFVGHSHNVAVVQFGCYAEIGGPEIVELHLSGPTRTLNGVEQ